MNNTVAPGTDSDNEQDSGDIQVNGSGGESPSDKDTPMEVDNDDNKVLFSI